jgi:hypothetical protein
MDRMVPSDITGLLLFPAIEQQLRQEPDGGSGTLQQLQQLLASRQPFSLHGLKMPAFSNTTLTLVFRCELVWAISLLLPGFTSTTGSAFSHWLLLCPAHCDVLCGMRGCESVCCCCINLVKWRCVIGDVLRCTGVLCAGSVTCRPCTAKQNPLSVPVHAAI